MIRKRNVVPKDFSKLKSFPGCAGNPFDRFLHSLEFFESTPNLLFIFLLLIISFIPVFVKYFYSHNFSFFSMVIFPFFTIDWLLIALLPRQNYSFGSVKIVVLMLALLRMPFAFLPFLWNLIFQFCGVFLVIYGFYIEPFNIDTHNETYSSRKIASGDHFCIVHISDIHLEHITRREKKIIEIINSSKPDLVVFTGDILNLSYLDNLISQNEAKQYLSFFNAPLGVYCVSGSPAVDISDVFPQLISDSSFCRINNEIKSITKGTSKIQLIGISCTHNPHLDQTTLQKIIETNSFKPDQFSILLYHTPDLGPLSSKHDIDLQLSGHTHGGQIRLPLWGALFSGSLYKKKFESGRYLLNNMTLYVSRGLGMEGAIAPRVRFLCRPEIIVWDICNE